MKPLIILTLAASLFAADAPKKPTVTPEQEKRYYRSLALIARAKEQAKTVEEQQNAELKKLIEEIAATGCVAIENEQGLACKPTEAAKK